MKKLSLSQVADIRTGVFARPSVNGEVAYLNAKDFALSGKLLNSVDLQVKMDPLIHRHLLQPGDVLFAAKGVNNFGAVYEAQFPAVASTTFLVCHIRNTGELLPEFLAWFLNEEADKGTMQHYARGSSIRSISIRALADLKIELPPIETQRALVEASRLARKEHELRSRIADLRLDLCKKQIRRATGK